MKKYIVTYIETIERTETIGAMDINHAKHVAEMSAASTNRKVKCLEETIDMNKLLCKESYENNKEE